MKTTKPDNIKSITIGEGIEMHEAYCCDYECIITMQDGKEMSGTIQVDGLVIIWDTLNIEGEV